MFYLERLMKRAILMSAMICLMQIINKQKNLKRTEEELISARDAMAWWYKLYRYNLVENSFDLLTVSWISADSEKRSTRATSDA